MSSQERHAYDEHLNAIMIQNDVLDTAKWEGRLEGLAEGHAEGLAEGKACEQRLIAASLKRQGVDIETIARCTGL